MRKTKEQKGITLVALIITIIVLLILAVVAIGAVQNDGIIDHAKNAREKYGAAQDNEKSILQGYFDKLNNNLPTGVGTGTGGNQGATITFTINGIQYTAENGMTLKQWAESDYDVGDKFIFITNPGFVVNKSMAPVYYNTNSAEPGFAANNPIVAGSAYYYDVDEADPEEPEEPEQETITFYYNEEEYTAYKEETWMEWIERLDNEEIKESNVYLSWYGTPVCYEDATGVKAEEEIRDGYYYTQRISF